MGLKGAAGSFAAVLVVLAGVIYQQSPVVRVLLDHTTYELTDNSACTRIPGPYPRLEAEGFELNAFL